MEAEVHPSEEIILCPSCRVRVQSDRICPVCGARLDKGDWPAIDSRDERLSPWSDANLLAPPDGERHYQLSPLTLSVSDGELCTPFPYLFEFGKLVVRIGGSSLKADVKINGAASLHAALLQNKRTKDWWIYDCGSDSGTFVNGTRVHCRKLQVDDVIMIAGVELAFRGNRLETGRASAEGMSLSVEDLCFAIRREDGESRKILDHVTFSVSSGEFVGILGPSGCGKSSLVQRIIGLSSPDLGEIYVNGNRRDSDLKGFRAATAYLPQNVEKTLHDDLTLDEEIDCFRRINLPSSKNALQENEDCLKTLGLSGRGKYRIGNLSGGEKRRVGIALALLRRPQLMLLDEPCAGLDPASEGVLMQHLRGIANQGRTVLCVTHVLSNLEKFDKLLLLSQGRIVYFGKPADLLDTFGVSDFGALYQRLEAGMASAHYAPPPVDRTQSEFPPVVRPSFLRRTFGYLKRMAKEFFALKARKTGGFVARLRSVLTSSPCVFCLWQPLGLVVGIRLACACGFRTNSSDLDLLGFCASLAMFWIGINNSARDLVKERVPGRCLESLNQVPCGAYLFSKFAWIVFTCAAQTFAFTLMLWISARIPLALENGDVSALAMSLAWFGPLYLSCLMGAFCGLAVSAMTTKTMAAVSVVPNIAIFALLFSDAMVRFKSDSYFVPLARGLAKVMPCHWASEVLAVMTQAGAKYGSPNQLHRLLLLFVIYAVYSIVLVWVFQRRNEEAWEGR